MDKVKEIKKLAKTENILCLFDMDGTCVEYGTNEKSHILNNEKDFFKFKRPLKYVLKKMKSLSKTKNVRVGILSNCYFEEQRQDKIFWLKNNAPFIADENINIIVLNNETYTTETKDFIKANRIKTIARPNEKVFFFEDSHDIIKATHKALSDVNVFHISALID